MPCRCSIGRFMAIVPIVSTLVGGCGKPTSQPMRLASDTIDLGGYQWKHRIVLVLAESDEGPEYRDFMGAWSRAQEGVKDRDLVVFQILNKGTSMGPSGPLTPRQVDGLRERFATAGEPLKIVLIGKDGEVKLRSGSTSIAQIFELIDTMPMRRAEMLEREATKNPPPPGPRRRPSRNQISYPFIRKKVRS